MFPLKRILFPVDFSERCRGAAAYVEALAGWFEAELVLLHVIEATYNSSLSQLPVQTDDFDSLFGGDLKYLNVIRLIEHGEPARAIIQCATARQVDLIMMPTQGMGIYRRLILGSTSAKVLHDADCPVWTGVHLEKAPPLEAVACQRILCAVDLKPHNENVLDWAHHLATEYQAELTVVHVAAAGQGTQAVGDAHHHIGQMLRRLGMRPKICVGHGDPARVVTGLAGTLRSDVLVIGRSATSGMLGRLEMTAYSIIRRSPCPVVSV